jgi:hypothetical protein
MVDVLGLAASALELAIRSSYHPYQTISRERYR